MTDPYMRYHGERVEKRQIDELIGLSQGLVADSVINQAEAEYLIGWMAKNQAASDNPIIDRLYYRVEEMLSDGFLDQEEAEELLQTLRDFSGGDFEVGEMQKSTALPFCEPLPSIIFPEKSFCFTGTFHLGKRSYCKKLTLERNAIFSKNITKNLDYLVIGEYATDSWLHSSYGTKIEKAIEYRDTGTGLAIVSEKHWVEALDR